MGAFAGMGVGESKYIIWVTQGARCAEGMGVGETERWQEQNYVLLTDLPSTGNDKVTNGEK